MAKTKKSKGPVQKQRANVYTMMLIVAFLFLSLGTFLLYKELDSYRPDGPNGSLDIEAKKYKQSQGTVSLVVPPPAHRACVVSV